METLSSPDGFKKKQKTEFHEIIQGSFSLLPTFRSKISGMLKNALELPLSGRSLEAAPSPPLCGQAA